MTRDRKRAATSAVCAVCGDVLILSYHDVAPMTFWIMAAIAILTAIAATWLSVRCRAWVWLTVAVFAVIGTAPILLVAGFDYACAVNHACL